MKSIVKSNTGPAEDLMASQALTIFASKPSLAHTAAVFNLKHLDSKDLADFVHDVPVFSSACIKTMWF